MHPTISAAQCRAARAMLGWTQTELSIRAKVSRQTVVDFERGARTPFPNNLAAIRAALEAARIEFASADGRDGVWLLTAPAAADPTPP